MKLISSWPLQFLSTIALAIAIGFAVPVDVDRHKYASAVAHYFKEPNEQNKAVLTAERAENQKIIRTTQMEAAAALFVLMNAVWLYARIRERNRLRASSR